MSTGMDFWGRLSQNPPFYIYSRRIWSASKLSATRCAFKIFRARVIRSSGFRSEVFTIFFPLATNSASVFRRVTHMKCARYVAQICKRSIALNSTLPVATEVSERQHTLRRNSETAPVVVSNGHHETIASVVNAERRKSWNRKSYAFRTTAASRAGTLGHSSDMPPHKWDTTMVFSILPKKSTRKDLAPPRIYRSYTELRSRSTLTECR